MDNFNINIQVKYELEKQWTDDEDCLEIHFKKWT